MKRAALILAAAAAALLLNTNPSESADRKEAEGMTKGIHWLGHDTFKIVGEKTIITDPFMLTKKDKADIVLITHEHRDHCSPDDLKKVQGSHTVIVTVEDCAAKLGGKVKTVRPGDKINVGGVDIEAVPAYNTNKPYHPRERGWVGFIITLDGQRIYLAGDTDLIPEMKGIKCDIAILPVSGTYVMSPEEAAQAALDIKPKVAIPMHYGSTVGSDEDALKFKKALEGKVEVRILKKE